MVPEVSINSDGGIKSSIGGNRKMDNGINCSANGSRSSGDCNGDGDSMGIRSQAVTYKRRKCGVSSSEPKLAQLEKLVNQHPASLPEDKMVEEISEIGLQKKLCEQACCPKMNCHSLLNGSDDSSYQRWRSTLQNLSQSFSSEGGMSGIENCIRDALCSAQQTNHTKGSMGDGAVLGGQCHTQQASEPNRSLNDMEEHSVLTSKGSSSRLNNSTVTNQCQHVLLRLIMSEKFKSLYKLLTENFHGVKFDKFLDFNMLNLKIKEGAYEKAPALFASDVQELWNKVHVIGTEMISLSKSLSDLSRLFCRELVKGGSKENSTLDDERKEQFPRGFDWADRREQPDGSTSKPLICKHCQITSDGRDCLVCDSCEEMFHVSCIKPAITEIPPNWYCTNCTALGTACPHEDCVVCERLNVTARTSYVENEEKPNELEESSCCIVENGIQVYKSTQRVCCKVCKNTLQRGELFRICEHHACNHYYHVRCLTNKQLKSYCSRWYCPCCLCRVCLTDKDDDQIVLCDACDNAYHIYCMSPPQKSIPEGQWYCRKCEAGLEAIRKAKLAYKSLEEKQKQKVEEKKTTRSSTVTGKKPAKVVGKVVDRSGGVDMLLNAANAISHQEQLAALNNSS